MVPLKSPASARTSAACLGPGGRLRHVQHRNALFLILGNLIAAAAGLLFWLLLARVAHLPPSEIGIGYAIVGLGATIAVLAKGGLDTALLRSVPIASRHESARLLRIGILAGCGVAIVVSLGLALAAKVFGIPPALGPLGWALSGGIAVLLVVTWLQDAYFLAEGDAQFGVRRNVVLAAARIAFVLPIIGLAWFQPVATAWLLALVASALTAVAWRRHRIPRIGRHVPRLEFLGRSLRHGAGSASEFLPGLLLAPLALSIDGATVAGHFAIAWTSASLLFLVSSAVGRSALAAMASGGPASIGPALGRGTLQLVATVAPAAAVGIIGAPWLLSIFGREYANKGADAFAILCASVLFVAPSCLYLALLRAEDRSGPLIAFPALMLLTLMVLAPILEMRFGLEGLAAAWLLANAPFGIFAALKLAKQMREVTPHPNAPTLARNPHLE